MKNLPIIITILSFLIGNAQFNESAPWMESLNVTERSEPVKFQEIVDAFNIYWEDKDPNVKGSGYKPFKRWETYWQNFVGSDGYLPSNQEYWNSWEEAHYFSTSNTNIDESNWVSLGPTTFLNRDTSVSNIGRVNVIVQDPVNLNIYYAGAPAGGIWKSTDSGNSWTPLSDNLPQIGVSGIAIDPNNTQIIYIATGDDDAGDTFSAGVYKSINGGTSWNSTGLNTSNSPSSMNDIYIHPNNSNMLWVATNNGIYKTNNGGTSWIQTLSGNIKDIKLKPVDPNTGVFDGTIYAVKNDFVNNAYTYRFYKSTNGGNSFSLSNSGLPTSNSGRMAIDVTPANRDVVYILSATKSNGYQGIYKSNNSGSSFTQKANSTDIFESDQAWFDMALAVSDTNEDLIFTGVLNIWSSANGGDSFSKINSWNVRNASYTHADIHFLRFYNGDLFAGTDGGFFKSNNNGIIFTDFTTGMEISQFYRISVSQQTSSRIAGGTQDNGGFGYDNQWSNYHGGDGMESVVDPNNDNNYYGFMQYGSRLFFSSTSGQSGTQVFNGAELDAQNNGTGNWITPLAVNKESEVYSGYNSLYKFNGNGWDAISPSFGTNIDILEIDPINPNNIFIAINNGLRKSTDRGISFSIQTTFDNNITSIEVNNNNSNIVYVTTSGFGGGVYKSNDGGSSFTEITGNLPSVTKNMLKHRPDDVSNTLFLGTHVGVFKYDDISASWEEFNNNLPNTSVRDLAINTIENKIVAGTYGRGIWESDMGTIQLATNDLRIDGLIDPSLNSVKCSDFSPIVNVKNNGQNLINTIDFTYSLNGGANSIYTWTGTLNSQENIQITLPQLNLSKGKYSLDIEATIPNDTFSSNNSISKEFFINTEGLVGEVNDFELSEKNLISYNTEGGDSVWERGAPTGSVLNTYSSMFNVYGTNLDGNHPDNSKSYLYTECYNLSNISSPVLKFNMAYQIEQDWDLLYVEYSIDEGNSWLLLGEESPNWYNSSRIAGDGIANDCYNCVGGQWTGVNTTISNYQYNLNDFTNESSIIFRFIFHADYAVNFEGAVIDDLVVEGTLSNAEHATNSFIVYPNPSNNIFNIKFATPTDFNFNIIDITGKTILSRKDIDNSQNHFQLNMSNFAPGIYFLKIESNSVYKNKKIILK